MAGGFAYLSAFLMASHFSPPAAENGLFLVLLDPVSICHRKPICSLVKLKCSLSPGSAIPEGTRLLISFVQSSLVSLPLASESN